MVHFGVHDPECVLCARQRVKSGVSAVDRTLPCSSSTIQLSSCNLGDSWEGAISQRRQGNSRKRRSPIKREHSGCALQGSREMEWNAWTFRAFSPERGVDCASPDARPTEPASCCQHPLKGARLLTSQCVPHPGLLFCIL